MLQHRKSKNKQERSKHRMKNNEDPTQSRQKRLLFRLEDNAGTVKKFETG